MADKEGNTDETSNDGTQEGQQDDAKKQKSADELRAELDSIRTALKKANAEAADRRKKLEAFETAEQKRKEAELSAIEKAQKTAEAADKRAADAEARLRESLLRSAVNLEAATLGFHKPADAWKLADLSGVVVGDDGEVTGAADALKKLVKDRPYLIAPKTSAPDIDATKRGKQKPGAAAEDKILEVSRRFGL